MEVAPSCRVDSYAFGLGGDRVIKKSQRDLIMSELPRILQIRQNALVAKYIYIRRLARLRRYEIGLTSTTVIVPIMFIAAQWVTKGTFLEKPMAYVSFVGSAGLICVTVYSLICGLSNKLEKYSNGLKSNIYIADESQTYYSQETNEDELKWFFRYTTMQDSFDSEVIAETDESERRTAYRKALQELAPSTITHCPVCGASPWKFVQGNCDACGNSKT
jgi:mobilome CxxCx(11)CxxC protein